MLLQTMRLTRHIKRLYQNGLKVPIWIQPPFTYFYSFSGMYVVEIVTFVVLSGTS